MHFRKVCSGNSSLEVFEEAMGIGRMYYGTSPVKN